MRKYWIYVITLLAFLSGVRMNAQSSTGSYVDSDSGYSPYSMFGLGDIMRKGTSYNLAMGGIGIGDRNARVINLLNPAAITEREFKSFMFDFGIENRNFLYESASSSSQGAGAAGNLQSANNITSLHHIVATLPIYNKAAFKLAIQPYSTIGYKFNSVEKDDKLVAEMGNIEYLKKGNGTIYQATFGVATPIGKHFSIGVDGNYYFGSVSRVTDASFGSQIQYENINTGWEYVASAFNAKLGLQFKQDMKNNCQLVIGATCGLPTEIKGKQTAYTYGISLSKTDTVAYSKNSLSGYDIPFEYGFGISFKKQGVWMAGFDYTMQDWSNSSFDATPGVAFKAVKSQNFRLGFEYTPNRYDIRYYFKQISYRAGAYREYTYMSLNGSQVVSTGFTLGMSFPIPRLFNSISLSVDAGQRGALDNSLVRERYLLFNVSFDLHDIWFLKSLYN